MLRVYLDANGEMGINPEKLVPPLVYISSVFVKLRDGFETQIPYDTHNILSPDGLPCDFFGFRFEVCVEPPAPIKSVMVQGAFDDVEFVSAGSHPNFMYQSSIHKPMSLLPATCTELTNVAIRSRGVCHRVIVSCNGNRTTMPNIRFIPIFTNHRSHLQEPTVPSLGQLMVDAPKDFRIQTQNAESIYVHRCVLAATSAYMKVRIEREEEETRRAGVAFDKIVVSEPYNLWVELVYFMYMRDVRTTDFPLLLNIVATSSMFSMQDLCNLAAHKVVMILRDDGVQCFEHILPAMEVARTLNIVPLKIACESYIQTHAAALILNDEFLRRMAHIREIDSDTDLYVGEK